MREANRELGAFLRSCRDRLTPAQAGIDPFPGPRRVPGLRKEELAYLTGLSADHYSRIEQGRQPTLGPDVVEALARTLRLDEVERQHLTHLADVGRRSRATTAWTAPQRPDPGLIRLMDALEHLPTLLIGRTCDVLASNELVRAVLGARLEPGSSFARWLLLDPGARERIANWPDFAAATVGVLRYLLGRHPHDGRLRALVDEVRAADPDVARWWADRRVTDRTSVAKQIDHPDMGHLSFHIEAVTGPHDPDQRLVAYTVEPGSPTAHALPLLSSWAASGGGLHRDRDATAGGGGLRAAAHGPAPDGRR